MIRINQDKATLLAKQKIREWRAKEFSINDVSIQNALADGDEQARIDAVNRRDWLRDLPQQCNDKNVAELKALLIELGVIHEHSSEESA